MTRRELQEALRNRGLGKRYRRQREMIKTRDPLHWLTRLLFPAPRLLNKTRECARRLRQMERDRRG